MPHAHSRMRACLAMFERAPWASSSPVYRALRRANPRPAPRRLQREELLHKTIHDITHPWTRREPARVDDMVAGVRDQIEFEKRYLRKDAVIGCATPSQGAGADGEPRYVGPWEALRSVARRAGALREQEALRDQRTLLAEAQKPPGWVLGGTPRARVIGPTSSTASTASRSRASSPLSRRTWSACIRRIGSVSAQP